MYGEQTGEHEYERWNIEATSKLSTHIEVIQRLLELQISLAVLHEDSAVQEQVKRELANMQEMLKQEYDTWDKEGQTWEQ